MEEEIVRWFDLRRRALAQFACFIAYYQFIIMRSKGKISYSMSSKREILREEIMGRITKYILN